MDANGWMSDGEGTGLLLVHVHKACAPASTITNHCPLPKAPYTQQCTLVTVSHTTLIP